jgi:hypothetical protein
MAGIAERLIAFALQEWDFFGRSTRGLDDGWHLVGDEADEPWRSRIGLYWAAVGRAGLDGGSDEPWSAAFVSWCFASAGAGADFTGSDTHSIYMGRVLRHDGMSAKLVLRPPERTPLAPGDLIWNARGDSPAERAAAPAPASPSSPTPTSSSRSARANATASAATSPTAGAAAARSPARPGA